MPKSGTKRGGAVRQLQQCLRNLDSFTDGQVRMVDCDWDHLSEITLEVAPNDGLYKRGLYRFVVYLPKRFPQDGPTVSCTTPIYHPNIDPESHDDNVCVSVLSDWTPSNTIEDVVQALLFLMYNPNIEDPLSNLVTGGIEDAVFEETQEKLRKREVINGEENEWTERVVRFGVEQFEEGLKKYEEEYGEEWKARGQTARVEWGEKLDGEDWNKEAEQYEAIKESFEADEESEEEEESGEEEEPTNVVHDQTNQEQGSEVPEVSSAEATDEAEKEELQDKDDPDSSLARDIQGADNHTTHTDDTDNTQLNPDHVTQDAVTRVTDDVIGADSTDMGTSSYQERECAEEIQWDICGDTNGHMSGMRRDVAFTFLVQFLRVIVREFYNVNV